MRACGRCECQERSRSCCRTCSHLLGAQESGSTPRFAPTRSHRFVVERSRNGSNVLHEHVQFEAGAYPWYLSKDREDSSLHGPWKTRGVGVRRREACLRGRRSVGFVTMHEEKRAMEVVAVQTVRRCSIKDAHVFMDGKACLDSLIGCQEDKLGASNENRKNLFA